MTAERSPLGLGPLEQAIMRALWDASDSDADWLTITGIREVLDYRPVAYTTVASGFIFCPWAGPACTGMGCNTLAQVCSLIALGAAIEAGPVGRRSGFCAARILGYAVQAVGRFGGV